MTVTLEIPPELEAQLCDRTTRRGQSVSDFLMTLAESEEYYYLHEWEDEAERQEITAVIEQRLADVEAGDKGILLEDFHSEMLTRIEERKQKAAGAAA